MVRLERKISGTNIAVESHDRMDLDELTALYFTENYATAEFLAEHCADGILRLGIGGGALDEHPVPGKAGKKGQCCTTLTIEALEIDDDPAAVSVGDLVKEYDFGKGHEMHLGSLIKRLYHSGHTAEEVIRMVFPMLDALYKWQEESITTSAQEYKKVSAMEEIPGPEGKTYRLVTISSSSPQMNIIARSRFGDRADIIVQMTSSGNCQIFTSRKADPKIFLDDVASIINYEEQLRAGNVDTTDWRELREEGMIPGGRWFFSRRGAHMLLNGSLTHPDIPPTLIPLALIKEFVKIGVNPTNFAQSRQDKCLKGICTSKPNNQCPYYAWGLWRCRNIRFQQYHKE